MILKDYIKDGPRIIVETEDVLGNKPRYRLLNPENYFVESITGKWETEDGNNNKCGPEDDILILPDGNARIRMGSIISSSYIIPGKAYLEWEK